MHRKFELAILPCLSFAIQSIQICFFGFYKIKFDIFEILGDMGVRMKNEGGRDEPIVAF